MTRIAPLAVLAVLPLIVGANAPSIDDEEVPSSTEAVACTASPGTLTVVLTDPSGRPLQGRLYFSEDPSTLFSDLLRERSKGKADTDGEGCAHLRLQGVSTGKKTYYVWALSSGWLEARKSVKLDAARPEAAGVLKVRVKKRYYPSGCFHMAGNV